MAATLLVCPKCAVRLQPTTAKSRPRCPRCGVEAVTTRATGDRPVALPVNPPPRRPRTAAAATPEPKAPSSAGPSRGVLLIGLGAAGFLLLTGAAVVAVMAFSPRKEKKDELAAAGSRETAKANDNERRNRPDDDQGDIPRGADPVKRDPHEAPPPPSSLSEDEQKEVNKAIEHGVEFLRRRVPAGGMGNRRFSGLHPLVGLTLLECGVPADDPALAPLVQIIRGDEAREDPGAWGLSETYSLSLTILFLDRLGDAQDEKLIAFLAARLIAGQNGAGGWSYDCPALSESEGQLLLTYLEANPLPSRSVTRPAGSSVPLIIRDGEPGGAAVTNEPGGNGKALSRADLPPVLKNRAVVRHNPGDKLHRDGVDDNSNTQFAILGTWAARRHRIAVDRPLALISARFHQSQNADGSWGYHMHTTIRRDSMTCAGLLGLAVARAGDGNKAEDDPAIASGLQFLGRKLQKPSGVKPRDRRAGNLRIGADSLGDLYWLWSIERVGMIFNLQTIGGMDWYAWGAEVLVEHQLDDGSWRGGQGPMVDTCFALLFLKRVNVAKDLTRQLQMIGPVRDPGLSRDEK